LDQNGKHFSHIYSYNKVMSIDDRRGISKILNRTNFRLMAWYFSPRESAMTGLKNVKLAHKMPMQSTGREKFTVYLFFKTRLWDAEDPWSDEDDEGEDMESSDEEEEEEEQEEANQENPEAQSVSDVNDTNMK